MKKVIAVCGLVLGMMSFVKTSKAQANWEVGLRFANNISIDATIPISEDPRLHAALYLENFGLGGYFDWMFTLNNGPKGLKFYPGVGPEFFFGGDFDMNVVGDFGVEYSFDFPLTLAVDWRPGFQVTNDFNFISNNLGLTARFRFGEGTSFKRTK